MSLIERGIIRTLRQSKDPFLSVDSIAKCIDARPASVRAALQRLRVRGQVVQMAPRSAHYSMVCDLTFITGCDRVLVSELRNGLPRTTGRLLSLTGLSREKLRWQLKGLELRGIVERQVSTIAEEDKWLWKGSPA
jgi:predicted transcriptional regulator